MEKKTVADALAWLKRFDRFHIRPGLGRMQAMLAALGHPERDLRFVHIGGTNGKGSCAAFMARVLREHNYDVGTFSSPAIMHELDRIQYNGNRVTDEQFVQCVQRVEAVVDNLQQSPTEFEVITVIALVYFESVRPDWVIWEVGLGGRWDSTNIVTPSVSVITNVGHDHMAILGHSSAEIAAEKAGIIKSGCPVITAAEGVPETVIRERAAQNRSPYFRVQDIVKVFVTEKAESRQSFSYEGLNHHWDNLVIHLPGRHQVANATLSLLTLEVLEKQNQLDICTNSVKDGLSQTVWPGRMELVSDKPRVLLDAAHNREASIQLLNAMNDYFTYDKLYLIIGIFADKDVSAVVSPLARHATHIIVTAGDNPRYMRVEDLAALITASSDHVTVSMTVNPRAAIARARNMCGSKDLILVAGSHDLMSAVRKEIRGVENF